MQKPSINHETVAHIKSYLLSKPESLEYFPFGPEVAVFKVVSKMFATLALGKDSEFYWLNLKCDPAEAEILRSIFPAIIPGYHMNKVHWNTLILDNSIPLSEIERLIDHSYKLVAKRLKKSERINLNLD